VKFEIRWTEEDKPQVRRADKVQMTDADRAEARALLEKMLRHEICWNCGSEWSETRDIYGREQRVCWGCARTA
jgi:hypothetical protein